MTFKKYFLILENFNDAKKKWVAQNNDPEYVDKLINRFKALKNQKKIKEVEKSDIGYWMKKPAKELDDYLTKISEVQSKKEKDVAGSKEVIKLLDTPKVFIGLPLSFNSWCYLAKGKANWCIASAGGETELKKYIQRWGYTLYYIHFKETGTGPEGERYTVVVKPNGEIKSVWNKFNTNLLKQGEEEDGGGDYSSTELYKKLREEGVNFKFRPLVKKHVRVEPVQVNPEDIKRIINDVSNLRFTGIQPNEQTKEKIKEYNKKANEKIKDALEQFLISRLKTSKLSDQFIEVATENKNEFAGALNELFLKVLAKNNIDVPKNLYSKTIIYNVVREYVNNLVGGKTLFSY